MSVDVVEVSELIWRLGLERRDRWFLTHLLEVVDRPNFGRGVMEHMNTGMEAFIFVGHRKELNAQMVENKETGTITYSFTLQKGDVAEIGKARG